MEMNRDMLLKKRKDPDALSSFSVSSSTSSTVGLKLLGKPKLAAKLRELENERDFLL